jgi:hypothetical protein
MYYAINILTGIIGYLCNIVHVFFFQLYLSFISPEDALIRNTDLTEFSCGNC